MALCGAIIMLGMSISAAVAQTTITSGTGSAVVNQDRIATFPTVNFNASTYSENGLAFTVQNGGIFPHFSGFYGADGAQNIYYPNGGGNGFTTIATTDASPFFGLELDVYNGYNLPTTYLHYEAVSGGSVVSSGAFSVASGSVVGFLSPFGFDLLRIGAYRNAGEASAANSSSYQALAISNVRADLTGSNAVTPEGSSLAMMGLGLLPLAYGLRRKLRKA